MALPVRLSEAPPPPVARPRLLLVGTSLAVAASVMVFAGMLGTYLSLRHHALAAGATWLPSGVKMPLTPANMGLVIMVMSSVIVQWAVDAISKDDRPYTYVALGLTAMMGFAFIVEMAYYYTQIGASITDPTGFGLLLYGVTGAHLVMVGAAMLFVGVMAFRTLGGQYSGRDREGVAAAALFWHATVAMYAVIWYAVFVTK